MNRYPLSWPAAWPRTSVVDQKVARFTKGERHYSKRADGTSSSYLRQRDLSVADGVQRVLEQLRAFGVEEGDSIISTNVETRLDGLPRSGQKAPADPGAAVYWQLRGEPMRVMAIDIYLTVADNLAAIAATLDAMRAIERHGGAQILERAFSGFAALPAPGQTKHWRDILDVPEGSGNKVDQLARAKMHYQAMRGPAHPDRQGGSHDAMAELNVAWDQAQKELA